MGCTTFTVVRNSTGSLGDCFATPGREVRQGSATDAIPWASVGTKETRPLPPSSPHGRGGSSFYASSLDPALPRQGAAPTRGSKGGTKAGSPPPPRPPPQKNPPQRGLRP